ncbi:MAG: hypothetical protein KDA89_25500, partial [Planctomycetaceae bacterium]|nr:hypothetical protein [Planctomycetaceae bacterium]
MATTAVGAATSGTDYVAFPLQLTIPAGQTSVTADITSIQDAIYEGTETITVAIDSATNSVPDTTPVTVDLTDDDVATLTLSVSPATINEADGTAAAIGTVTRNTVANGILTVQLTNSDSTEVSIPATVRFAAGSTTATFPITAVNDLIPDGTQTVTLSAMATGFITGTADVDVEDATTEVNLLVSSTARNEADGSAVTITAVAAKPVIGDQTLDLVIGGTNVTPGDYTLSSATITIPDGQTTGSVTFRVVNDAVTEAATETVQVSMSNLSSGLAAGATPTQTIDIIDNDSASVSIGDVTVIEGDAGDTTIATLTVTLSGDVDTDFTVDFSTQDVTALSTDNDYVSVSGQSLNFTGTAGETVTLQVAVNGDSKVELNETLEVLLGAVAASGRNVAVSDGTGIVTITNDDAAAFRITDVGSNEGDSGTTRIDFTVSLDAEIDTDVTIDLTTVLGTASANDLAAAPGTGSLTFFGNTGGPQTRTFSVDVVGDTVVELDETFTVNLSGVSAGGRDVTIAAGEGTATSTIINDDQATLSIDDVSKVEGNNGTQVYTFTVTLTGDTDTAFSVNYSTVDGTATAADGDYTAIPSGVLNFNGTDGETRTIAVTVRGDQKVELSESFFVELLAVNASGRDVMITKAQGTGTIDNDDSAVVRISDASVSEGNSGSTVLTFTVSLDHEVDVPVSVDADTSDDTATIADNDYSLAGSTVHFSANVGPGIQSQTFTVNLTGDTKVELDERLLAGLSNLVAGGRSVTLDTQQAVGTIINDDSASVTINDASVTEGDSGSTVVTLTVTLDAEVDVPVRVNYATAQDTAGADDFTAASGMLTFPANGGGSQTQTISVSVSGDELTELDEILSVALSQLVSEGRDVTITDNLGLATILNDDTATLRIDDVSVTENNSGTQNVVLTVSLDGQVDVPVNVDFSTADGTAASSDGDYTTADGTLNFAGNVAGGQSLTITVEVAGDERVELDETFLVSLAQIAAGGRSVVFESGGTSESGVVTITNDDAATVTIGNVTAQEGSNGDTTFSFTVTLTGTVDNDVRLNYSTVDETATAADGDYTAVSNGLLVFVAGQSTPQTRLVSVTVHGDSKVEDDESFLVALAGPQAGGRNVSITNAVGRALISNDDSATLSVGDVAVAEGIFGATSLTFTVTLSNEVDEDIMVIFDTQDGTATTASRDYIAKLNQPLTFPAGGGTGPHSRTVTVSVIGDGVVERDETIQGILSGLVNNGRNVTLSGTPGTATILNDDTATITITDAVVNEPDSGPRTISFNVRLSGQVDVPVSLNWETEDGTALLVDGDYEQVTDGILQFSGAESEVHSVTVEVNGDRRVEPDETFFVNLLNLSASDRSVQLADSQAQGTIIDNDRASLSIGNVTLSEGTAGRTFSFVVTLDENVTGGLSVDYRTVDGTAVSPADYTAASGTLSFLGNAGETQTITVPVIADGLAEPTERFFVDLFNVAAGGRNVVITQGR